MHNNLQDIELIGVYGAKALDNITRRKSPEQLELMELQYNLQQKMKSTDRILKVWQKGAIHSIGYIVVGSILSFGIGYVFGGAIIDAIAQRIGVLASLAVVDVVAKRLLASIYLTSISIAVLNVYDVGRLSMWVRRKSREEEGEGEIEMDDMQSFDIEGIDHHILSLFAPPTADKKGTWVSTTDLLKIMKIDYAATSLGRDLKRLGYQHKRAPTCTKWLVHILTKAKDVPVAQNTEEEA